MQAPRMLSCGRVADLHTDLHTPMRPCVLLAKWASKAYCHPPYVRTSTPHAGTRRLSSAKKWQRPRTSVRQVPSLPPQSHYIASVFPPNMRIFPSTPAPALKDLSPIRACPPWRTSPPSCIPVAGNSFCPSPTPCSCACWIWTTTCPPPSPPPPLPPHLPPLQVFLIDLDYNLPPSPPLSPSPLPAGVSAGPGLQSARPGSRLRARPG